MAWYFAIISPVGVSLLQQETLPAGTQRRRLATCSCKMTSYSGNDTSRISVHSRVGMLQPYSEGRWMTVEDKLYGHSDVLMEDEPPRQGGRMEDSEEEFYRAEQSQTHIQTQVRGQNGEDRTIIRKRKDDYKLSDSSVFIVSARRPRNKRHAMTDDGARRVIKERLKWESQLRHNKGQNATRLLSKRWLHRTPAQMERFLRDGRMEYRYPKHVHNAILTVRGLGSQPRDSYDFSLVMNHWVGSLSFREMCIILKEQHNWIQAHEFFKWMQHQGCYRPSVIPYTILMRMYGQVKRFDLIEGLFFDMLQEGCDPDDVMICSMICIFSQAGKFNVMMTLYRMMRSQDLVPPVVVFNTMLSSLYKAGLFSEAVDLWEGWHKLRVPPNSYTYSVVINAYRKVCRFEEGIHAFEDMMNAGHLPDEMLYNIVISMLGKLGRLKDTLDLFERMKIQGLAPSKYTYTSLAHYFCKGGDYENAIKMLSEMQSFRYPVDEVMYAMIITMYSKLGMYNDAEQAFRDMEDAGLMLTERIFVLMAKVRMKDNRYQEALQLLEEMQSRNLPLTKFGWITKLQCLIYQKNLSDAEVTFLAMRKNGFVDTVAYTCMFTIYRKLHLYEEGKALLKSLRSSSMEPDDELYGAIISLLTAGGFVQEAESVYDEMQRKHVIPSQVIKTMLMHAYGKTGRLEDAAALFQSINAADATSIGVMLDIYHCHGRKAEAMTLSKHLLGLDISAFNNLLVRCASNGDLEMVDALFNQLEGCMPREETVVAILAMLGKQSQLQKALDLFEKICYSDLSSSAVIHKVMIDACIRNGKVTEAYSVFQRMNQLSIVCDAKTVTMIVDAFRKAGMFTEGAKLVKWSRQCSLQLDTVAYNTFIDLSIDVGNIDEAFDLLAEMQSVGLSPTCETYSIMIIAFGRMGDIRKAQEVFESLEYSGFVMDEVLYGAMIDQYGKAGKQKEAVVLFQRMKERGIQPCEVTLNIMMNVHARSGLVEKVEELFGEMKVKGFILNPNNYLPLFVVHGKEANYQKLESLLEEMHSLNLTPEIKHYHQLMVAYGRARMPWESLQVYKRMEEAQLSPDLVCQRSMLLIFVNNGCYNEGVRFYEETSGNMKDDIHCVRMAVEAYEGCRKFVEARETLKHLETLAVVAK